MSASQSPCRRALASTVLAAAIAVVISSAPVHAQDTSTLDDMVCPVAENAPFSDSWGEPRSGGRRHEGVDMLAARGTRVVASLAGFAEFKNTSAGGLSIWLTTPDGDKFFYAHLDAWEGESRDVAQGDVIGYVGSSGNAGGPHLHFEVRPGGRAVNPYPMTRAACDRQAAPALDIAAARPNRGVAPGLFKVR